MSDMTQDESDILEIVTQLEAAWNAGDGVGFARPFEKEADFINVMGMHAHGHDAIEAGHRGIFASIYKGSRMSYRVEHIRFVRPDVALVLSHAYLTHDEGATPHSREARPTMLFVKEHQHWHIAMFHNTYITSPPTSTSN